MTPEDHTRGDVLVVDDEPTIAEVVARYLERAGYDTRIAGDGLQAIEMAGRRRPDLVVLDLMLPGLDGLEVMRRLRDADRGHLAVILLTAKGEESDRVIGLRLGADDYVVKPFSPAESAHRDLVAAVSHDLRTPITSLRLLAEAVGDDIVDAATRRRYLATMATHIDALGALIDDLFELSRLEAGDIEWSMERVRVDDLVGDTVAAMRPHAEAEGVEVLAEVDGRLAPARANPEKVQRVLFNLIQNAIRHTPADGSVTVRALSADGRLEIEVADTGEGIAPDDRERVFDPFYRGGSQAPRSRAGTGLGLAISRAIVEAHGGRIWLEDAASGTRVRFSLPRAA